VVTIYNLVVCPFILVFQDEYWQVTKEIGKDGKVVERNLINESMVEREYVIDIIYCMEIALNFFKWSNAYNDIQKIAIKYIKGYFFIDVIATFSGLYWKQHIDYYWLKMFRLFHLYRLTQPLNYFMMFLLKSYSKKRQNDLSGFASLILIVIYSNHINACIWLYLGRIRDCTSIHGDDYDEVNCIGENVCCKSSWTF